MDWIDYREKLGIGFNDKDKFNYFFVKVLNVLEEVQYDCPNQINEDEYFCFCNMTATPIDHHLFSGEYCASLVSILEDHDESLVDFISYYIAFINCQKDNGYKELKVVEFKNLLCNALKESHIPYDVIEDESGWFLFPKGAKELDDALVSETLCWMKDYPLTQKAWITALKDYSESTELTASETADNFRKALERFFQEFFESEKSLENLKSEYGNYLSSKGVPNDIKNNFQTLLQCYTNYINEYAKHHDRVSKNVLEYIMYQTGNIIRLLIKLKQEE